MKTVLIGATVAMSLTSGAYAGSVSSVVAEPEVQSVYVAPVAPSWGGFYAGLSAGKASGDHTYNELWDGGQFDLDGNVFGAFVGYKYDMQPFVLGVELAAVKGPIEETDDADYKFDHVIDLKASAGYSFGKLLVSGIVGYSTAKWDEGGTSSSTADGMSYGLGADYLITDNFFVGAEYLKRNLDTDDFDGDVDTLQARIGYKF